MDWNRGLCIIVYSIILVQCCVTMTITYIKVKKTDALIMLLVNEFFISLWLIFGMFEIQSQNEWEMFFSMRFSLFPIVIGSATWLIFALVYAKFITLKSYAVIAIIVLPKVILYLPNLTTKYFYLSVIDKSYISPADTNWGLFSELNFTLGYIYIMAGITIIMVKAFKDYKILKFKILLVILGPLLTLIVNISSRVGLLPYVGFDLTPVTFSVFALLLSLAIFKYSAFEMIHNATMDVFRDNEDAIIIIDNNKYIADYNGSAEDEFSKFINISDTYRIEDFFEVLKGFSHNVVPLNSIMEAINNNEEVIDEYFSLDSTTGKKYYSVISRHIKYHDDKKQGSVIKISNRTLQTVHMLKEERNRISGDIHDNLSNMINVVSMNLDYSIKHIENEDNVLKCMNVAYQASSQIRLHLRRILDELTPVNIKDIGVIHSIESLFKRVKGIGVDIEFTYSDIDDYVNFDDIYGMLIYNTCMEGINNALFNGQATSVNVELTCKNEVIHLKMQDNGCGCESLVKGRGLMTMEQRFDSLDGEVEFTSEEGKGFLIDASIPIRMAFAKKL